MAPPLISVVTPTWQRHDLVMNRCVASVQAQDYPNVEHVLVSDGPDPVLRGLLTAASLTFTHRVRYFELAEHHMGANFGSYARRHGIAQACGEYVTYNDDDDMLRPYHCTMMAEALDDDPGAGFAVSRMISHSGEQQSVIGWGALGCGNLGTPMIAHRQWVLDHGMWGPPSRLEDWEVVAKWLAAGVRYVNVNAETSDVWPSIFR